MSLRLNGSTSGYVEIDAPDTASDNTLVLPNGNGTSGQYLQTDGLGALSWGSITPNKIVQVVHASDTATVSNSDTTTWSTLLTQTITLSSESNYVLVFAHSNVFVDSNSNAFGETKVFHTDTSGTVVASSLFGQASTVANENMWQSVTIIGKHSPASTAQQTYVFALKKGSTNTTSVTTDTEPYNMILVEVAG